MTHEPDRQLAIYLNDHRAGSVGGQALARRCAQSNEENELGAYLADVFVPALSDERRLLDEARDRVGARPNPVKDGVARLGELIGRLKPNGGLVQETPLSRVVEVEGLIAGVHAKQQLWRTLAGVYDDDHRFDDAIASADEQLRRLDGFHAWARSIAFDTGR